MEAKIRELAFLTLIGSLRRNRGGLPILLIADGDNPHLEITRPERHNFRGKRGKLASGFHINVIRLNQTKARAGRIVTRPPVTH